MGKRKPASWFNLRWFIGNWKTVAGCAFLVVSFGAGFYLAELYGQISAVIEQRRAALASTIYSAPLRILPGDDLERLNLRERLKRLAYHQSDSLPAHPGEYSDQSGVITIYARGFDLGARTYPPTVVRIEDNDGEADAISDESGKPIEQALLEPQVIGRLMPDAPAERVEVALANLKPYVVNGLLATEDRFFYYHPGFDPIRVIKAAIIDLRAGRLEQGASTITQQLARTFLSHERTFGRKFREFAIAIVLELRLKKREILERYINDVPLGGFHGAPIYGLPLAARYFFDKDLRDVTPAEAATLIGMIRAPTLYDPRRHPELCRQRRDTVLAIMHRAGLIGDDAYLSSRAAPVAIAPDISPRPAPYFADYVASQIMKIPGFHGTLAGVKVYTTLDPQLQAVAERSVRANLARLERNHRKLAAKRAEALQSSMAVLEAASGAIVAMVGGRDYAESQFNRAAMAERQPGSAFKPIVYLTALDPGRCPLSHPLTLASMLPDRRMSFGGWVPANYERTYRGEVTVADALADSLNAPTAYVGSLLGPPAFIRAAHDLGIKEDLPAFLPVAIGAGEVTLLELVSAYQVFADNGVAHPPYAIESVIDGQGHLIFRHERIRRPLIRPAVAYLITAALQGVIQRGTAARASALGLDFPAAGKTGTTDSYRDAYFIGYTPQLAAGVWVGFDKPRSMGLTGAQAALPAWVDFMLNGPAQEPKNFVQPPGIVMAIIDPETGALATEACPRRISLPFLAGTQPMRICSLHGRSHFFSPSPAAVAPITSGPLPPPSTNAATAARQNGSMGFFGAVGRFFSGIFGN